MARSTVRAYPNSVGPSGNLNVRCGSFATGANQHQVRPCPLCPESDRHPFHSHMSLRAKSRPSAMQQKDRYSITSSVSASNWGWNGEMKRTGGFGVGIAQHSASLDEPANP
jgi:hypothetical protein